MKHLLIIVVLLSVFLGVARCQIFGTSRRPLFGRGQRGNRNPGQGNPQAQPRPSIGFNFVTNAEKACLQKCDLKQGSLGCPVIPTSNSLSFCSACLGWECSSEPFVPGFVTEQCEISRYTQCQRRRQCPNYAASYQRSLSTCLQCRDNCLTKDKQKEIQNVMKTVSECVTNCSKTDIRCPTIPPDSCRSCAKRQCELAGTRTMICLMRNIRQTSRACPTCGNVIRGEPSQCACASTCLADSSRGKKDANKHHWAFLRFLPVTSIKCLSSRCSGVCPDAETRTTRISSIPQTCKKCIEARCSRSSATPGFDDQACRNKAYSTCGTVNGCPFVTVQQRSQDSACISCYDGCITQDIKKDVRAKMATADSDTERRGAGPEQQYRPVGGGNLRRPGAPMIANRNEQRFFSNRDKDFIPETSVKCLNTNCESKCKPTDIRVDRDDVDRPCGLCISALCRRNDYRIFFDNLRCRKDSHLICGPFFGCEVLDPKVVSLRSACQTCVDNCIPENVKVQARNKAKYFASCVETCKTTSCGHREKCQKCLHDACMLSSAPNCQRTARSSSCLACSFSTSQEEKCNSCDKNCRASALNQNSPTAAPSRQGVYVKPQQKTTNCSASCASLGCPATKSQVQACETCLNLACAQHQKVLQHCRKAVISGKVCACPGLSSDKSKSCSECYISCS